MLSQGEIISIMQDAVFTVIIASAPMLITALVVGLIVSIIQATTQINEQTLAFVPKIICIFLVMLLAGGFILTTLSDFTIRLYGVINSYLG